MTVIDLPRFEARKAVILARVSRKEQEEGHSIDAQQARLQGYCQRRGLEVVKVFTITESSTKGDRQKFMAMIRFIKDLRYTVALVTDKVDRLQRSFREFTMLDDLVREGRLELHFNTEGYVIHQRSNSHEHQMWGFSILMAKGYTDSLRDNVKRSQEHMVRAGLLPGVSPIGYLNIRDAGGKAAVIVDPERAPLIQRLFREFATGAYTVRHLQQKAKEWGLRNKTAQRLALGSSQIHRILTNRFYYGVMNINGKDYPHRYEALIDRQLFEDCEKVLKGWKKKPFAWRGKEFAFRGLIKCAHSGKTVTADTKRKTYVSGKTAEWTYLRAWDASGKATFVREDIVVAQAEKALAALAMPPHIRDALTETLRKTEAVEREYLRRQTGELKAEHTKIQTRIDGLMDLLLDKAITRDDYDRKRLQLRERQAEIEAQLKVQRDGDDGFKDAMLFLMDLCGNAAKLFAGSTPEEKRQFLNFTLSNLTLDGEKLKYSYKLPFGRFADFAKNGEWSEWLDSLRTDNVIRLEIVRAAQQLQRAA